MTIAKRYENKYIIHRGDAINLINKLNLILKKDLNNLDSGYLVTSLYYDNPYNTAFFEKIDGIANRSKYRIRYYNEDKVLFKLEKKSKYGHMTHKKSVNLTYKEVEKLMHFNYSFLREKNDPLYLDFYEACTKRMLTPKALVRYRRHAFIHAVGDLRITFDEFIQTSINKDLTCDSPWYQLLDTNSLVMEVKFNGIMPDFIGRLIESATSTQLSASKYVYARKYNLDF